MHESNTIPRALSSNASSGVAAATKKWRDLINIHELDRTTKTVVSDQQASKTVTAFVLINMPVPRHRFARVRTVRPGQLLNQLRRGHRAWPMFSLKSGAAMAAPAAPMPLPMCYG